MGRIAVRVQTASLIRQRGKHHEFRVSLQGKGVDVILDCIGAPYLEKGLDCLAVDGCIIYIGLMGGAEPSLLPTDLPVLQTRHILGSILMWRCHAQICGGLPDPTC